MSLIAQSDVLIKALQLIFLNCGPSFHTCGRG